MLAAEEAPEKFAGIQFLYEDSQYDPKLAITAFSRLVEVERVPIVLAFGTGVNQALAPLAEKQHVPLLALGTDDFGAGKQYVVRFGMHAVKYAEALLEYLRRNGWKRIALIKQEVAFFNEVANGFTARMRPEEQLVVNVPLLPEETDFRPTILQLKKLDVDAVGAFVVNSRAAQFFAQARDLHLDKPVFGLNTFESRDALAAAQKLMPGVVFPSAAFSPGFATRYTHRFGSAVQIPFGAVGHDFASLTAILKERRPATDEGLAWMAAMRGIRYRGECGMVRYTAAAPIGAAFEMPAALRRVTTDGVETVFVVE